MKDENENSNHVTVQIQVSKGIAQFIRDHSTVLTERYGTSNIKEFVEAAVRADFTATVDDLHLNIEEIRAKYAIERGG